MNLVVSCRFVQPKNDGVLSFGMIQTYLSNGIHNETSIVFSHDQFATLGLLPGNENNFAFSM
jgi:hypothetical protein